MADPAQDPKQKVLTATPTHQEVVDSLNRAQDVHQRYQIWSTWPDKDPNKLGAAEDRKVNFKLLIDLLQRVINAPDESQTVPMSRDEEKAEVVKMMVDSANRHYVPRGAAALATTIAE